MPTPTPTPTPPLLRPRGRYTRPIKAAWDRDADEDVADFSTERTRELAQVKAGWDVARYDMMRYVRLAAVFERNPPRRPFEIINFPLEGLVLIISLPCNLEHRPDPSPSLLKRVAKSKFKGVAVVLPHFIPV